MIDSISPDISCFILSILISLSATKYPWTERKNYKYKSPLHAELHRKTIHLSELIKPHITTTPLIYGDNDPPTYFKMESRQITGSFKMRGALSKVLTLTAEEKRGTITTASTGNHGRACARAFNIGRVHGTVYLPCNVNKFKLDKLKAIMGETASATRKGLTDGWEGAKDSLGAFKAQAIHGAGAGVKPGAMPAESS